MILPCGKETLLRYNLVNFVRGFLFKFVDEFLQVHKLMSLPAHKEFNGGVIEREIAITAMTWNKHSNLLVTGDADGLMHYSDEAFHEVTRIPEAHKTAIRGMSSSPFDTKLVSCRQETHTYTTFYL